MDEREMFEAYALSYGGYSPKDLELFNGQYIDEHANTAFDAWQAARRTTPDREAIIEECAKVAERTYARDGFHFELGTAAATYIRALKTAPTLSPRDTLIEEIAEMVDHMGEGRRLEEYVGAIREMKSGNKGGA